MKGMLLQLCPCCVKGRAFSGLFKMPERCAVCGLRFEPEPGYFAGALYISYAMGLVFVIPLSLWMIHRDYSTAAVIFACVGVLGALSPLMFRYSRLIWIYFDVLLFDTRRCPENRSAPSENGDASARTRSKSADAKAPR